MDRLGYIAALSFVMSDDRDRRESGVFQRTWCRMLSQINRIAGAEAYP
jgi:hypothetical protein